MLAQNTSQVSLPASRGPLELDVATGEVAQPSGHVLMFRSRSHSRGWVRQGHRHELHGVMALPQSLFTSVEPLAGLTEVFRAWESWSASPAPYSKPAAHAKDRELRLTVPCHMWHRKEDTGFAGRWQSARAGGSK